MALWHSLPSDALSVVLRELHTLHDLISVAATNTANECITDNHARELCEGARGCWCEGRSWRVQLAGRTYHSGQRVRRVYNGCTTATRTRARKDSIFTAPAAICAISNTLAAVADAKKRNIQLLEIATGRVVGSIDKLDGVPTGVCVVPPRVSLRADALAAERHIVLGVLVQGLDESGDPIRGVSDERHRLEFQRIPVDDASRAEEPLDCAAKWSTAGLS